NRVADVLDPVHFLHLRVLEEDARDEPLVHQDVDVLVDRRGDEEPAVLLVVRRQVGPPAAERDAEGAAGHDHGSILRSFPFVPVSPPRPRQYSRMSPSVLRIGRLGDQPRAISLAGSPTLILSSIGRMRAGSIRSRTSARASSL